MREGEGLPRDSVRAKRRKASRRGLDGGATSGKKEKECPRERSPLLHARREIQKEKNGGHEAVRKEGTFKREPSFDAKKRPGRPPRTGGKRRRECYYQNGKGTS